MKRIIFLLTSFLIVQTSFAGPGDTIKVQTFTFGSPQDAWFVLPDLDVDVEKILMKYTLKCNPDQSPACGEWDYLTYSYLYDHTGQLDSTLLTHANYEVNGQTFDSYAYSTEPVYQYVPSWMYNMVYDDTISLNEYQIGDGAASVSNPLSTSQPLGRTQYIWTADELLAAGMNAGDITGMQVYINEAGSLAQDLIIRMAVAPADTFNSHFYTADWTTVYHNDVLPFFTRLGQCGFYCCLQLGWHF
ncbi:MAG: hypothetical protein H6546_01240 [Chitinophagales bacterium]|nr:hypothetical protein [Chitinophagales bacterium]HQU40010.1 hypothetical protein [Chitinophagales bacterium]